jgi:hypothetical protein
MPKPYTHIIVRYPSKNMDLLYRASGGMGGGMALGCRNQLTVLFGENPDPKVLMHRNFIDQNCAEIYLRECAHLDANHLTPDTVRAALGPGECMEYNASIEYRDGESRVLQPNGKLVGGSPN